MGFTVFTEIDNFLADFEEDKANFELLFHKGLKVRHKGSNVLWTVVDTYNDGLGHRRAIIKSRKGYTKTLNRDQARHFKLVSIPKAVKVLYGIK